MTTLRRLWSALTLAGALALVGCEGSGGDGTDAGGETQALDAPGEVDGVGPRETTPLTDICCAPDPGEPFDAVEDSGPADVPYDPGTPDVPDPAECCHTDDECPPNATCVAGDLGDGGVCHEEQLPDGSCFTDADCGGDGLVCKGETLCSCDMDCSSVPGSCHPSWGDCCLAATDCPAGQVCAGEGPGGTWGVCELPSPEGTCWDDDECPLFTTCEGEAVCGCDADCDVPDAPGACQLAAPCCESDADCLLPIDQLYVCAAVDATSGVGKCVPAASPGQCWDELDCPLGQDCWGASMCPCDLDCLLDEGPGTCVDDPGDDCCGLDEDCPPGYECVYLAYADDELPGACKPLQPAGMCWDDTGCAAGELCVGANPCPCDWNGVGDGCDLPGTCQ